MTQQTIDLPAGTIHYRSAGPEGGRPVVFVHGFLVDDTLWADVPERLAARGLRTYAATWPLAAHRTPMHPDAPLSPRDVARIILSFLEELDLHDVVLVGSDTGGAVCQFLLDEDASRIGCLVLTNCDAFDVFPPFPFNLLFRLGRHPRLSWLALQPFRWARIANGPLGFGLLTRRPITSEESRRWLAPSLTSAAVRRDTARFLRGWRTADLTDVATRLHRFERPVLLAWAPKDRFFKLRLAHGLRDTFPDARLVEMGDARTFVSLDEPAWLADEIAGFVGVGASS